MGAAPILNPMQVHGQVQMQPPQGQMQPMGEMQPPQGQTQMLQGQTTATMYPGQQVGQQFQMYPVPMTSSVQPQGSPQGQARNHQDAHPQVGPSNQMAPPVGTHVVGFAQSSTNQPSAQQQPTPLAPFPQNGGLTVACTQTTDS